MDLFLPWAGSRCELYRNYILRKPKIINVERANELGKLFGYEITEKGIYREKSMPPLYS